MKKLFKNLSVVSILLVGLMVNASNVIPSPTVKLNIVNSERFNMFVDAVQTNVEIQIKDVEGEVLYSKVFQKGTKDKSTYDISELPEGVYYVKVIDKMSTKVFSVNNKSINLIVEVKNTDLERKKQELLALAS